MAWLPNRRQLAFAVLWAVSSVLMGVIVALAYKQVLTRYFLDPDTFARVNALYLKTALHLDDQQYQSAYRIMQEGRTRQLTVMSGINGIWTDVLGRLETASDAELISKRKELQSILVRMPETNMGMLMQLRSLLPPNQQAQLGKIIHKKFPPFSMRPNNPSPRK